MYSRTFVIKSLSNPVLGAVAIACLSISTPAFSELKALDDDVLAGVSGQSGLTVDVQSKTSIGEVAYFDDGKGIALQGIRLAAADDPNGYIEKRYDIDISSNGDLNYEVTSANQARFEIEEIRFIDTPGLTPGVSDASLGGFFFDYETNGTVSIRNVGNGAQGSSGALGGVYDIDLAITNGRLGYRTNGNEIFWDGMELDINSMGTVLGVAPSGELVLEMPRLLAELKVDAIRFSNNENNHGVTNDVDTGDELASYGSLWANLDVTSTTYIDAGGADGAEGLRINSTNVINRLDLAYGDDTDWAGSGYWVGFLGATGSVDVTNLTIDILDDPDAGVTPAKDYGTGLAIGFEGVQASLNFADIVLGETKSTIDAYVADSSTAVKSIGGLGINLLFGDGAYNGTPLTNQVFIQAGGNTDAGYQGLRFDTQLSIVSPGNESNFVYTEDGNSVMLSGFEAYADGDLTLDVTKAGVLGSTEFYDGLRIGFEDFAFGYRLEGLRVAESTGDDNDLKTRDLQGGHSVQGLSGIGLGLGGHPSVEGTLNGHVTLGAGGRIGDEGITVNSDITLTDGTIANFVQADGTGKGLWLSGLNYDVHLRDMMLDVTDQGIEIYEGESWSTMDVTDFRVGDKDTGASFGRLIVERYELGSETVVSAGGAGTVCIGGVGADSASCAADGGRWEDRGSQGLTIATKTHFGAENVLEGKRNRITWETNRIGEGTASPVNGTGMQLVFDNFRTNDGDGLTDDYGFRADYNIDVARAPVVKKEDGPDSNGVVGNKGDEKIMNADGTYRYVSPGALTAADIANRPVGIAVRTRTHFKELDFERVNVVHGPSNTESTLLYGLKLQNFDVTTDITATPLD